MAKKKTPRRAPWTKEDVRALKAHSKPKTSATEVAKGRCQSKRRLVDMQRDRHLVSGDLCRESAPLGQGSRASLLVDLPRDEMALLIELVVHLGMN